MAKQRQQEQEPAPMTSAPPWSAPDVPDLTDDELAAVIRAGGFRGVRVALADKMGVFDDPDLNAAESTITSVLDGFFACVGSPDPAAVVADISARITTLAVAAKAAVIVAGYIASNPGVVVNVTGTPTRYFTDAGQDIPPAPRRWGAPAIRTGVDPTTGESEPHQSVGTQYYGQGV